MNYIYITIGIIIITVILFVASTTSNNLPEEYSSFERKPASTQPIQLGFLKNTPDALKEIITEIQSLGSQLVADTEFDQVATNYLDPSNIG